MSFQAELERAPRGCVGELLHDAVARECAGGAKRGEAFAAVAERSGRSPAAVSEAYYRVERRRNGGRARSRGGSSAKTTRRNGGSPSRQRASGSEIERLLAGLERAVGELADLARANERELGRLREQSQTVDRMRKVLAAR